MSLEDPLLKAAVPHAASAYTLNQVADAYNDLQDIKAYAETFDGADYPGKLFPSKAQNMGVVLADIDEAGLCVSVQWNAAPPPRDAAAFPIAFAWLNLERASHPDPLHSNILVWSGESTCVRFEPHGGDLNHPLHAACGFQGWYSAASLDAALVALLGKGYSGPDAAYPVLYQSITRNDGAGNSAPLQPGSGVAFKRRRGGQGLGDSFCGAWALLYLALVVQAQVRRQEGMDDKSAGSVLSLLGAPAATVLHAKGVDDDAVAQAGRQGADLIASFILHAHAQYKQELEAMAKDARWQALLEG